MERILYIYLLLIIALLLLIGYYCKFDDNKKIIENEKFNSNKTNMNNFTKKYINNKFNSDPDYHIENISQFNYDRLYNKLQMINNEKIELEGPLNNEKYIVSTIDDKLRRDLDNITKYVLLILNQDNYYNFSKTSYGNVEIFFNQNNDSNYIYNYFYDKKIILK